MVDFIKWTSTFGEDAIKQMETPLTGVRLTASMLPLFGVAIDDMKPMLAMHENEAPWLAHLPIQMALIGYGDGVILVTDAFTLFETSFPAIGIEVFVPYEHRETFEQTRLMGLCHVSARGVKPVNRIFPVFTPERYELERRAIKTGAQTTSLFSGI
ncbi:hypothetical protein R70006_04965 [Paraburkholderia domus]|uniref:hypothetical protein n=1 Tax=Paraburkholderia domus TaxID=2793075 RepID=UPI001B28536D|nr:hypothetical protein [Paraburkholderia domus]CAE6793614.1 hypothetical protein R70006_04965 [Paraburkholderia domus]